MTSEAKMKSQYVISLACSDEALSLFSLGIHEENKYNDVLYIPLFRNIQHIVRP